MLDRAYEGLTAEEIYERLDEDASASPRNGRRGGSVTHGETPIGKVVDAGHDLLAADDPRVVPLRDADMPDREALAQVRSTLREDAAARIHGRAGAMFKMELDADEGSRIDWRALLRRWLHDRIKTDWSSWPYSKKHIHRGLYMPSLGVESPGHIVFAIDTSASMPDRVLSAIVAELRAFRETFPCRLTVIQADAAIQSIQHHEALDGTEVPRTMEIKGRGGTSFRSVFDWLDEQDEGGSTVVLYATDGFGTFPLRKPDRPVIWLVTPPGSASPKFPFGTTVRLPSRA
jgi:predicted metal-dependent peptidase